MDFIRSPKPGECVFCTAQADGKDEENLLLHRGDECFVLMNLYPYTNGHLLIIPYRHVQRIQDLSPAEHAEMMSLTSLSVDVLEAKLYPEGFNCGLNLGRAAGAGIEEHLHMHVVPRWIGDVSFMSSVCSSKVIVQHLRETYAEIQPEFGRLASR